MADHAKQIIYRYNGDPMSDEGFVDWTGELSPHAVGQVIIRKGKLWKVEAIDNDCAVAGTGSIRIHRVFLTNKFYPGKRE